MPPRAEPIPDWYLNDWTPSRGRDQMPLMTWEGLETAVRGILPNGSAGPAVAALRSLAEEASTMTPMDLLQGLLIAVSGAFDPRASRTKAAKGERVDLPPPATGPLPRWSYTDLEVALTYIWRGPALMIVLERKRDLLDRQGERMSPEVMGRALILLAAGLPAMSPPDLSRRRGDEGTRSSSASS